MLNSSNFYSVAAVSNPIDAAGVAYLFGSFRLIPSQQILLDGESRVPVGSRALDLLTALVERRGELVTKNELIGRAWPQTVVEEGNLKVHIAALRKALGEGPQDQRFVTTVVGRGYRFVASVTREMLPAQISVAPMRARSSHTIPAALVKPIGRAEVVREVIGRLARIRLLTIAGTGGVGKTTVALAVAHAMAEARAHEITFVDLSALTDASRVPRAVANAMGLPACPDDALPALTRHVRQCGRPQLLVLDGCEHVIETAAVIAEHMTSTAPQMHVLATSREPLQAIGEHIHRLEPFECPADDTTLTMNEALRYPAVELFMERAMAARGDFGLSDEDAPVVARICRRLDGIALAIELAAACLNAFGVHKLLDLLDDRFFTLAQGRRTAPDRQRTFQATLDWSHALLPEVERVVLRRLAIFPGAFALSAAAAVLADDALAPSGVIDALASLVAKSMLCANVCGDTVRYRLLDTTRAYARRKLADAGELDTIAHRHAAYFHDA